MTPSADLLTRFDTTDPAFQQDPYPVLDALREAAPVFWYEPSGQWMVTRHAEVHAALRDRRMGRIYTHRYTDAELGRLLSVAPGSEARRLAASIVDAVAGSDPDGKSYTAWVRASLLANGLTRAEIPAPRSTFSGAARLNRPGA